MQTDGLEALNQKLEVLLVLLPLQFTGTTLKEDREKKMMVMTMEKTLQNLKIGNNSVFIDV